jgi:hypothetical protein
MSHRSWYLVAEVLSFCFLSGIALAQQEPSPKYYVTDGDGNSRVLKFDKYGRPLLGWGMKGGGPGKFGTPQTIAIDGDLVYVGEREKERIQIFD